MGIQVEFNPDLALRNISEYKNGNRELEECMPERPEIGETYNFLKKEQRLYWLHGELPLLETKGHEKLSLPLGSIVIEEVTHILIEKEVWTKGKYRIVEWFKDDTAHFNGLAKL